MTRFVLMPTAPSVPNASPVPSREGNPTATPPQRLPASTAAADTAFVTRNGNILMLHGRTFRFSGPNIHWLGLQEGGEGDASYPTRSSIDQAFADANAMHASVIRAMTAGINVGCPICIESNLDSFNDAAFSPIDYAIHKAASYNMHIIIPLAADRNDFYNGSMHTFAGWLGISVMEFYTDPRALQAYETYISHVLNHVNTYTGVAYKDDPTIMVWEVGNETYDAPDSWTETIAKYIKSIDQNHLVGDSKQGSNDTLFTVGQLQLPDVDIYTSHFYFDTLATYTQQLQAAATLAKQYNKLYFIGEYDWTRRSGTPNDLQTFLTTIENTPAVAGDTFWQLYPQGMSGDQYSLVYPGQNADVQQRAQLLSEHAQKMHTAPSVSNTSPVPY